MIDELWNGDFKELKTDTTVQFQGKAVKMDSEVRSLLYETYDVLYDDTDLTKVDYDNMTVPYILTYYAPDFRNRSNLASGICLAIGLVFDALTAFLIFQRSREREAELDLDLPESKVTFYGDGDTPPAAPKPAEPVQGNAPSGAPPSEKTPGASTPTQGEQELFPRTSETTGERELFPRTSERVSLTKLEAESQKAPELKVRRCPQCGAEILHDDSRFCIECGSKLS